MQIVAHFLRPRAGQNGHQRTRPIAVLGEEPLVVRVAAHFVEKGWPTNVALQPCDAATLLEGKPHSTWSTSRRIFLTRRGQAQICGGE